MKPPVPTLLSAPASLPPLPTLQTAFTQFPCFVPVLDVAVQVPDPPLLLSMPIAETGSPFSVSVAPCHVPPKLPDVPVRLAQAPEAAPSGLAATFQLPLSSPEKLPQKSCTMPLVLLGKS